MRNDYNELATNRQRVSKKVKPMKRASIPPQVKAATQAQIEAIKRQQAANRGKTA